MKVCKEKVAVYVTAWPSLAKRERGHSGVFCFSFTHRLACYLTARKKFRVELMTTVFQQTFQYLSEGLNHYKQIIGHI
jgi:hypothetical protein